VALRLGADPVRAAWLALLNPVLLVHAVSGGHADALMAGLLVAAVAVALGGERTLARALAVGALVGLAIAVKATALVLLPFAALLVAPDRRWWPVIRTGLVTGLGTVATYGAWWALTGYGLGWLSALRGATPLIVEATSIPTGIALVVAHGLKLLGRPDLGPETIAAGRAIALGIMVVALVGLWLWARRRFTPRDTVLATGLALATSVVLGPVAFPWYLLSAVAILAYGIVDDRLRYRVGLLVAPTALLILPNGNGLGAIYRRPLGVVDALLVLVLAWLGLRKLRRRRAAARVPAAVR
jgi:hypothetical protein